MKQIDLTTNPLEVNQLITPRSGSSLIDFVIRFSENKKLITFILLGLFPVVIWIEMFALPNHPGMSLYLFLIILFSVIVHRPVLLIIFAFALSLLRYSTYLQSDPRMPFVMLIVFSVSFVFTSILVSKIVTILIDGRDSHFRSINSLLQVVQMKDHYTALHSRHVAEHALAIAKEMNLSKEFQRDLYTGGLLHDIGKIGVADYILLKPGKLTKAEYDEISKHPQYGVDLLKNVPFLRNVVVHDSVLYHHERYDGHGYPTGLKGKEIPLAGRILAVADTYDAVTTHRVYQSQRSPNEAIQLLKQNSGSQFDPSVVNAFLAVLKKEVPVYKMEQENVEVKTLETV